MNMWEPPNRTPVRPNIPLHRATSRKQSRNAVKKTRRIRWVRLLLFFVLLVLGAKGCQFAGEYAWNLLKNTGTDSPFAGIRPLWAGFGHPPSPPSYTRLVASINTYLNTRPGMYGVAFIDLTNNGTFGINDTKTFFAASTFKLPMNIYLYKQIEEGKIRPDDTRTYNPSDYEEGTGWMVGMPFGTQFTIRQLSEASIVASDNVATNILLDDLGIDNVKAFMRSIGGKQVEVGENTTTPADMALYAKTLYAFYRKDPDVFQPLIDNLEHTDFSGRITGKLPEDVPVAHKIGNWPNAFHDVGIVFLRKHPYVLALFSDGVDEDTARETESTISKMVYDFQAALPDSQ
jgi:beta-lactamase class A